MAPGLGSLEAAFPYAGEAWLWDAIWHAMDGVPVHNTPSIDSQWQPYGGWTRRAGLQYAGDVTTFGVVTDWDLLDYERMGLMTVPAREPEPRKMTTAIGEPQRRIERSQSSFAGHDPQRGNRVPR